MFPVRQKPLWDLNATQWRIVFASRSAPPVVNTVHVLSNRWRQTHTGLRGDSASFSAYNMDFNVRKLATDAGIFFSRAVQVKTGRFWINIRV